jgi:hypothetical protein
VALLILSLPVHAKADSAAASEFTIKAAIIFKIAKFVSWPEQAFSGLSEPLTVCVKEGAPIAAALSTLSGKSIHGRVFTVKNYSESLLIPNDCQILLVNSVRSERQTALLDTISSQPILTIGDNDQFIDQSSIIGLEIKQNRVQFVINVAASESAGLDISAQLLQLAKITDNRQGT